MYAKVYKFLNADDLDIGTALYAATGKRACHFHKMLPAHLAKKYLNIAPEHYITPYFNIIHYCFLQHPQWVKETEKIAKVANGKPGGFVEFADKIDLTWTRIMNQAYDDVENFVFQYFTKYNKISIDEHTRNGIRRMKKIQKDFEKLRMREEIHDEIEAIRNSGKIWQYVELDYFAPVPVFQHVSAKIDIPRLVHTQCVVIPETPKAVQVLPAATIVLKPDFGRDLLEYIRLAMPKPERIDDYYANVHPYEYMTAQYEENRRVSRMYARLVFHEVFKDRMKMLSRQKIRLKPASEYSDEPFPRDFYQQDIVLVAND